MRNKTLTRIIIATLLCALLVNAGRATRAYALALPVEEIQPVYDTEILALKDYVETNLDNPQLDIFFLLGGALAVAQLGAQDAMLQSPYPNETSVKEWIINCGIQLYNALIGLVPSGDYYVNIPLVGQSQTAVKGIPRSMIKALVAQMMGNAVVAKNYPSVDDFLADDSRHLMPFQRDLQTSINAIWQLQGGPYHWQFDTEPFSSGLTWNTGYMSADVKARYDAAINSAPQPTVRINNSYGTDWRIYAATETGVQITNNLFRDYHNLFIDTEANKIYVVNDSGQKWNRFGYQRQFLKQSHLENYLDLNNSFTFLMYSGANIYYTDIPFYLSDYDNKYVNLVRAYFHNEFTQDGIQIFYEDWIDHVYVGTTWINKQEIFNVEDLNISDQMDEFYRSPDQDVFIDIKDMIENLVNKTSIWDFLIDHLFDIDGNLIIPNFPTFSVDLTPITDLMAPPIPVDLNDFALYADNDYLEEIRDRSEKFGETIGEYFVFWHNADPVTVYVIFGSVIVILLGAFVGKLGHS